jgi:hypothetical protein
MAGNTRGKLKEHFEGIHRNFDWSLHHINTALKLVDSQVRQLKLAENALLTDDDLLRVVEIHPLYQGIKALGEGIQTLDDLSQGVYATL